MPDMDMDMDMERPIRIVRVAHRKGFTVIDNRPLTDRRLSYEARGLLGYLLTRPDHWQVRLPDLVRQGTAGKQKIRRVLAELQALGYMRRTRKRYPNGRFGWETIIYEVPRQDPKEYRVPIFPERVPVFPELSESGVPMILEGVPVLPEVVPDSPELRRRSHVRFAIHGSTGHGLTACGQAPHLGNTDLGNTQVLSTD